MIAKTLLMERRRGAKPARHIGRMCVLCKLNRYEFGGVMGRGRSYHLLMWQRGATFRLYARTGGTPRFWTAPNDGGEAPATARGDT